MDIHYFKKVRELHRQEEQLLLDKLAEIRQQHSKEILAMVLECERVHGQHDDDGSFLMGFCKRCGVSLG